MMTERTHVSRRANTIVGLVGSHLVSWVWSDLMYLWSCWLVSENVLLSHSQPAKKFDIKRAPWQLKVMIMTEMCRKSFDLWGLIRNQRMIYCYWQYATQLSLLGNPISFLVNLPSASPVEFLPTKSCAFWIIQPEYYHKAKWAKNKNRFSPWGKHWAHVSELSLYGPFCPELWEVKKC